MNYSLACLISFFLFFWCNTKAQKNCNISIYNNTSYNIDSIRLSSYGVNYLFKELTPRKKIEKNISVKYSGKYEGVFLLTIYVKDSIKNQTTFGYYANADDIKPRYSIELYDNFLIKEKQD